MDGTVVIPSKERGNFPESRLWGAAPRPQPISEALPRVWRRSSRSSPLRCRRIPHFRASVRNACNNSSPPPLSLAPTPSSIIITKPRAAIFACPNLNPSRFLLLACPANQLGFPLVADWCGSILDRGRMKASVRFRDDRKPLVRAKVPISVLGLPFLSGVSAGEARELRLDLATAFESGPSLRLSYRPNDSWSPFGLAVKTGIGAFGSPASAALTMSAEFNLLGRGGPSFAIQLKPRFGDFCVKKLTSSANTSSPPFPLGGAGVAVDHDTDGEDSIDGTESPGVGFRPENGLCAQKRPNGISTGAPATASGGIRNLFSGAELTARSVLPLRKRTAVKFRWGVRVPSELRSSFSDDLGISLRKLPLLVMSKISIVHLPAEVKRPEKVDDVAEACLCVQRQLAALQAENGMLRKAVEELRADVGARKPDPVAPGALTARSSRPEAVERKPREGNRNGVGAKPAELAKKRTDGGQGGSGKEAGGKVNKEDVNEELRKALMEATGGGV